MKHTIFLTILILIFNFAVFSQTVDEQNETSKFDEFGRVTECEEGARLDVFLVELSKNKSSKGIIIFRSSREKENYRSLFRIDTYLYFRKVDKTQISYVINNNDNEPKTELWIAFENGKNPKCENCKIIKAEEYKKRN